MNSYLWQENKLQQIEQATKKPTTSDFLYRMSQRTTAFDCICHLCFLTKQTHSLLNNMVVNQTEARHKNDKTQTQMSVPWTPMRDRWSKRRTRCCTSLSSHPGGGCHQEPIPPCQTRGVQPKVGDPSELCSYYNKSSHGKNSPTRTRRNSCPAYGTTCGHCGWPKHFAAESHSKGKDKRPQSHTPLE